MSLVIFFLIFLFSVETRAQQVYISKEQKLSAEMIGFDVLGSLPGGELMVYKKYRFDDEIDIYDKEMKLRRTKDLTIKGISYETREFIKLENRIFQFYEEKNGKTTYLKYQEYTLELERKDDPVLIDSTISKIGENSSNYKIIKSENEQYIMCYQYAYQGGELDRVQLKVLNRDGRIVMASDSQLPSANFNAEPIDVVLSSLGRPVFLFENLNYSCKKDKADTHFYFLFPGHGSAYTETRIEGIDGNCVKEMAFGIDNLHNIIIATGFIGNDAIDDMNGIAFLKINGSTGGIIHSSTYNYSQELTDNITGMMDKSSRYIPAYKITTVIPRMDGGVLMVGEYYDKNIENYDYTNYDPYYGYRTSTRQVEYYEYSDVLLLSLNSDGEVDWSNIIRKRQLSKEDRGVNSSFGLLNGYKNLFFIFNEDIAQNSNVLMYQLSADGTLDRQSLFNPSKQEVELRPVAARQISHNEIIIPSVYKRNLAFIKLEL